MVETAEEPKEEEEDVQSTVDCALAAFAAAHQLDVVGIFCSDEWQWEAVLEAINQGPLPPLNRNATRQRLLSYWHALPSTETR